MLDRPILEILMERDIARQAEIITTDFATWEMYRHMTRQEFRTLLRERLQEFGDKCLAAWDEKCGGRD